MDRVKINLVDVPLRPEAISKLVNMIPYDENIFHIYNNIHYIDSNFLNEIIDHYREFNSYIVFNTIMAGYDLSDIYANPQNYPFTTLEQYRYFNKHPELTVYRLTHCLPYRSIGIDIDGCIRFNDNSKSAIINDVYRKIYGTIYTINWQNFCQSGRIKIIYLTKLQQIINFYFNPGYDVEIKSYEQACQIIMLQLPAIQKLMQNINSPEEWSQFIRSRYNQRIIQQSKRSIPTSPSNIPSTRIKLE